MILTNENETRVEAISRRIRHGMLDVGDAVKEEIAGGASTLEVNIALCKALQIFVASITQRSPEHEQQEFAEAFLSMMAQGFGREDLLDLRGDE
jgi:hypothetical protein